VDFLSHAALVGFMAGATIMIGFSFRSVHQEVYFFLINNVKIFERMKITIV